MNAVLRCVSPLTQPFPPHMLRVIYNYGFPIGPFQMSDLAGLDVSLKIRKVNIVGWIAAHIHSVTCMPARAHQNSLGWVSLGRMNNTNKQTGTRTD